MNDPKGLIPAGQILPATAENRMRIEQRWEGLKDRVEAKVRTLHGRDRNPELRMVDQAQRAGNATKRVTWLRKAADYFADGAKHLAACGKGCAHCCHITVMVSRTEAQVIAKETGAALNPSAGRFTMNSSDVQEALQTATAAYFGKPCTFLKGDQCGVYGSRPLQCRLLINLDEDPLLCQLIEGGETNVPYLNATDHHVGAVVALGPHQEYADIREWFPVGLGDVHSKTDGTVLGDPARVNTNGCGGD
ncbi:YkgJ family cysteine cluster protein [Acidovorax sp. LjRoot194]